MAFFAFLLLADTAFGQGFPASHVQWNLPSGGRRSSGIIFGYNEPSGLAMNNHDTGSETYGLVDMDGDGKPDLVVTAQRNSNGNVMAFSPGSNSYWKVYLNNGNGHSTTAINWGLPTGGKRVGGTHFGYSQLGDVAMGNHDTGSETYGLFDMDGDGKPDLVVAAQRNSNGNVTAFSPNSNSYWKVYLNTGNGFSTTAINWGLPNGGTRISGVNHGYYRFAADALNNHDTGSETYGLYDMNGDGRPDLVVASQRYSNGLVGPFVLGNALVWKVYLNNGNGYSTTALDWGLPDGGVIANGVALSFNRFSNTIGFTDNVGSQNYGLMDMNGDGRPELVVTSERFSNGYVTVFSPNSNSYWKVYTNTGTGFNTTAINWSLPQGGANDGGIPLGFLGFSGTAVSTSSNGTQSYGLLDMNGDGRPELVVTSQRNSNGYVSAFGSGNNRHWRMYNNTGSGFNTTATNWSIPAGGTIIDGLALGYNFLSTSATTFQSTGSESYATMDMDGDGKPDLVVTAQRFSNGNVTAFSPGSNSYWKVYLQPNTTGIAEWADGSTLRMYPNPATDRVTLASDRPLGVITVLDVNGRMVKQLRSNLENVPLPLDGLDAGAYFVRVENGQGNATLKLVVQ
jgi:hypothetical protein